MPLPEPIVHIVDDEAAIRDSLAMLLRSVGLRFAHLGERAGVPRRVTPPKRPALPDRRRPHAGHERAGAAGGAAGARRPAAGRHHHRPRRRVDGGARDEDRRRRLHEKPFNDQMLLDTVHRALARPRRPAAAAGRAAPSAEGLDGAPEMRSPPREREVMLHSSPKAGRTRSSPRGSGLSTRTVEVHRAKVMEKMQARSLADLVRMAIAAEVLRP